MDEAVRKTHRGFAVSLFNRVWELLEKPDRSANDDIEMLNAAHASLYHWLQIGEAKNFSIGEWQLSRVYATLRRATFRHVDGARAMNNLALQIRFVHRVGIDNAQSPDSGRGQVQQQRRSQSTRTNH